MVPIRKLISMYLLYICYKNRRLNLVILKRYLITNLKFSIGMISIQRDCHYLQF
jgi:hypothetical protein